ncbi:GNAT family N-acetyltransferase [Nonomuraea sp. NPDC049695]|uniref:GNAT family N-acetyltransferase n=1 Tax=Nonomuraea sp. NPDC049695 TaxID=3154734 RepID=UPI00341D41E9
MRHPRPGHGKCRPPSQPKPSATPPSAAECTEDTLPKPAPAGQAIPDPELGHDAEIYALAVRPGHQGHGHGCALVRAAAADLSADGFGSLVIRVLAVNESARRFYTSLGGVLAGKVPPDAVCYSWPEIAVLL